MRLLSTNTFTLNEFFAGIPKYAIVSHTWGTDEVSFQDIQRDHVWLATEKPDAKFAKIKNSCEKAASQGYEFIWIDTCCIDKTSSSELSEAINSMFRWYQKSDVCYAYLADVDVDQENYDVHGIMKKAR